MQWRVVRQKNGKYARFSSISNNFTHMNMSNLEAYEICRHYVNAKKAKEMVKASEDMHMSHDLYYDYYNWDLCIDIIDISHGAKELARIKKIDKEG
jgi:hypothetical protein